MENVSNEKAPFSVMKKILKITYGRNKSKLVFSVLLFTLLQTVLSLVLLFANASVLNTGTSSVISNIIPVILFFASNFVNHILFFGLNVMMIRFVNKDFVSIGYLFAGFRKDKRVAVAALMISIVFLAVLVVSSIIMTFTVDFSKIALITEPEKAYEALRELVPAFMILLAVIIVFMYPFIFTWTILYADDRINVFKALGQSFVFVFKNLFRFIGFVIYSAWPYFLVFAASQFLSILSEKYKILGILSFALNLASIISEYVAFVHFYLAIPVFFFGSIGVIKVRTVDEAIEDFANDTPEDTGHVERLSVDSELQEKIQKYEQYLEEVTDKENGEKPEDHED